MTAGAPTAWRLLWAAFAVWAAAFLLGYAAALLFPDGLAARVSLVVLTVVAALPLAWIWRRAGGYAECEMVRVGVGIAAAATLFNGLAAFA